MSADSLCLKRKTCFLWKESVELTKFYLISEASFLLPSKMLQTAGDMQHCMVCFHKAVSRGLSLSKAQFMFLKFSRIIQVFLFYVLCVLSHNLLVAMKAQNWSKKHITSLSDFFLNYLTFHCHGNKSICVLSFLLSSVIHSYLLPAVSGWFHADSFWSFLKSLITLYIIYNHWEGKVIQ